MIIPEQNNNDEFKNMSYSEAMQRFKLMFDTVEQAKLDSKFKRIFYKLRKEADKFVDNYNQKAKFRRGLAALRNIGIKATLRKVYSHYYSKVIAHINA